MSATTLKIQSDLKIQLDRLAQQRRICARIQEGMAQAQRGEFVSDEEMEAFFARHSESTSNHGIRS